MKNENTFLLLGRLATAIKDNKQKRALELLELIIDKVSEMDLKIPQQEREIF